MKNNLRKISQELRAFAKRTKDFKYTNSALITFLMTGMLFASNNIFAENADTGIKNQVNQINTSINQIRTDFKRARKENNKLIKDTNLELTQLMEQGDHVTKSPWSSWQYGMNYFYNDWHGTFKGKGNKIDNVIYKRDQTLNKYIAKPISERSANNTTTLGFAYEPNAAIPISASITPKSITKTNPNIQKNVAIASLPSFEPRVVVEPVAPTVTAPNPNVNVVLNINSSSRGSGETIGAFASSGESVMESVAVKEGELNITTTGNGNYGRSQNYTATNVKVVGIRMSGGTPVAPSRTFSGFTYGTAYTNPYTSSGNQAFFQSNGSSLFGITLNGAKITYQTSSPSDPNYYAELVHQDVHGGSPSTDVDAALTTAGIAGLDATTFGEIYKTNAAKTNSAKEDNYNVFANAGDITISGDRAIFTHSYNHGGNNGIIMNAGNVTLNKSATDTTNNHAVFLVSASSNNPDVHKAQQHFYNTGSVTTNTENTAMFLFVPLGNWGADDATAVTRAKRPISVTNKNKLVINGDNSVGIFANNNSHGVTLHLNFSTATSAGSQTQITDHNQSSNNNGYVNTLTGGIVSKDSARGTNGITKTSREMTINSNKSAGLYMPQKNSFINGQFAVELTNNAPTANDGSAGIYSNSDVDLQGHYVKVGGKNNVGVYPVGDPSQTIIYLGKGTVEVNGGEKNSGIVVKTDGNGNARGRVYSESEMVMEGGKDNTAIYVGGHSGGTENDVTIKSLETDTTAQEDTVYIYSENKGKVKTDDAAGGLSIIGKISSGNPEYNSATQEVSKTVGAAYAKGKDTVIDISQTATNTFGTGTATPARAYNIDITGAQVKDKSTQELLDMYSGFGLFAKDGAKIKADYNKVKAVDTGAAIASVGKDGSTASSIILDNGEVYYKGSGFALFTKDGGEISLQSGKLTLDGKATGFSVDYTAATQPINLTGTQVDIDSDDAILMSVKNVTSLGTTGMGAALLSKVNLTPANIGGTGTRYKFAVLDGATINVDGNIDKADTTSTSDSYIFTRRIQLQNTNINVLSGNTVKAHLNTTELASINPDLTVPVGLDVSASGNSTSRATTGVNIANGATITVDRTDSGNGGVGAYVNYGTISNDGKIEVEKTTPNDFAVGLYATNGTQVDNKANGTIEVGGKDSIGILGLSYRIDSAGNVVYEKFGTVGGPTALINKLGYVDVTNSGKITLDGENALGIYTKNNSLNATGTNADYARIGNGYTLSSNKGEITMSGKNAIGMITEGGEITNDTAGKITISGQEGVAMYGTYATGAAMTAPTDRLSSTLINKGTLELADTTGTTPIIGMFTNDADTTIETSGTLNIGKKSYGIYGASNDVTMSNGTINVGEDGVGIFATGSSDNRTITASTVDLRGGTINVGNNQAVGVFIADDATNPLKTTVKNTGTNMTVGTNAFGYVVDSTTGTDLLLGTATNKLTASLGPDSVYAYSNDKNGYVYSNTDITTTGGKSYGLYTAGKTENYGNIDLTGGNGNVGIYSTGRSSAGLGATNYGTITVGGTDLVAKEYGIGMATGYYNETTGAISNEGLIENRGTINVGKDNSIGMYAVGAGSKAINHGTIDISGKNATGMYIDQGAEGINYGTIKSTGSAKGIKGVATVNGGYIKNYGTISITSPDGIGIYQDAASALSQKNVPGNVSGTKANVYSATSTDQKYIVTPKGTLLIQNPPKTPRLTINGKEVALTGLDTNVASPTPSYVTAGATTLDLSLPQFADFKNSVSNAQATELGMYVDTSGVNYTHPIEGLSNLVGLDNINLIIGTEASKYTNAKAIEIGSNIIKPYNDAISSLTTTGTTLNINSAGLTWLAQPLQGTSTPIEKLYMIKIPYTFFTSEKDENSYNFLDGLEQRYGVEGLGTRERQIFDKLNGIGKGETELFTQAVDEMKGHQYSNTQQRINATGNTLDKEFKYLRDEWRNPSKQNNKIKAFGTRDEYSTDTAGIIDYRSNAYGVAYVHEDEKVRMGNSIGWYAGAVTNRFKFKDIGHSTEDQTMVKLGVFKTLSPKGDYNGALQWTISGDVFAGVNNMKRRFWVVDDTFEAKSTYHSYGAAIKNELGYDIRMSERTHLRPYGALKMEYGKFNEIKEKTGQMRLEVKGNDYFSVKPEVGMEFKYVQPLAVKTNLTVGLTAAYENEIGKLQEGNQARVGYTTAGWYNLEKEKEDRRGNGKFDLNIGVDNTRFGVTVNAGYDTKGNNVRGGIGFRAIY